MLQEKTIACVGCGAEFPFSIEEQEFYMEKGFSEPKRCKPCRDMAKQQKRGGGGGGAGGAGGGYSRGPRQLFDAVCSGCGCETQVHFKPDGRKPVNCRECFQASAPRY